MSGNCWIGFGYTCQIEGLQCYDRIYYEDNDLKWRTCGVKQSIVAVSDFFPSFMESHIYVLIL